MINVKDFLKCVDIDETILQINGVEYLPKQLLSSFFSEQIAYMKVSDLYVNQNNMITAVIYFD